MTIIDRIAALLKQTMGLDVASVGISLIERAVGERMTALQMHDQNGYLLELQKTPSEMQQLIEQVVVPETFFFRDREAISALAVLANRQLLGAPARPLRILSLPCSTGEEPYSIAMALLDAGIAPDRFRVDAIDISSRALGIAEEAIYGSNSFRGKQLDYRDQHFVALDDRYILSERIRKQVHFRLGNLFAEGFLRHEPPYDYIFCRNVLIYFDRPMQDQAVGILERLLTPQGTLFVGSAESGILLRHQIRSAGIPLAFAFQRRTAVETTRPVKKSTAISLPFKLLSQVVPHPVSTDLPAIPTPVKVSLPTPSPDTIMQRALSYANQGDLQQARNLCAEHEKLTGPSAAGFYMMGLISDASNDEANASRFYRKAIYLQPDHVEALTHLAALLASQGDNDGALRLQQRAQRVTEQSHA